MPRIKVSIKTNYGEIEVSGEDTSEIIKALNWIDKDFIQEVNSKVSGFLKQKETDKLEGILRVNRDGPVIVTKKHLSHYESIGLILYAYKDNIASSKNIRKRLSASGKKVTVPARINEMRKRGHVFKPDYKSSEYKLSTKGLKWIEDEVLPRLLDEIK